MDAGADHAQSGRGHSRPPLITPSASPPPHSLFARVAELAPPNKRPRLASVSRSSSGRLSASMTAPDIDVQKEREASRARLLDTWSHLAERYSRRLDEDDIVDIRTGEIVKDNGFWRNTRTFTFGQALVSEGTEGIGEGEEAEEVFEDETADELDAFFDGQDYVGNTSSGDLQSGRNTPAGDQFIQDASDLQDFLEAEKRRRREYGSDLEGEEIQPYEITDGDGRSLSSHSAEETDYDDQEASEIDDQTSTGSPASESAQEESASDDELDDWGATEASIVVISGDARKSFQDDSTLDAETAESSVPYSPSYPPEENSSPPTQLHTPPHSHSSANLSSADVLRTSPFLLQSSPSPSPISNKKAIALPKPQQSRDSKVRKQQQHLISQEIIELSDSDVSEPGSPSFALNSTRGRAHSVVPEVVITTLPPQPNQHQTSNHGNKSDKRKCLPSRPASKISKQRKYSRVKAEDGPETKDNLITTGQARSSEDQAASGQSTPDFDEESRRLSPEICDSPQSSTTSARQYRASTKKNLSYKRKRSSSEYEVPTAPVQAASENESNGERMSPRSRGAVVGKTGRLVDRLPSQRSRSRSKRVIPPEDGDHSSSDESLDRRRRYTSRRLTSTPTPNIQPPYTPHAFSHPPGLYPPIPDPRAQHIITHAMHQLAALLWTPTQSSASNSYPYTPTHHRFSSVGPSFIHPTPDHPHPYPFTYDPSLSKATIPPDSPEPPSSPIGPRERRKSLVSRGQSRGRRVSFHLEQPNDGHSEDNDYGSSSPPSPSTKHQNDEIKKLRSPQQAKSRSKGKRKAVVRDAYSDSEADEDPGGEILQPVPVTMSKRAQTPTPEPASKGRARSISTSHPRSSKNVPSTRLRRQRDGGTSG